MKIIVFGILLLATVAAWAEKAPNPAEFTVAVHVSSSHIVDVCRGSSSTVRCGKTQQQLNVVINGKKYELKSKDDSDVVLRTGDYKAKDIRGSMEPAFEYSEEYEFLLPNGTTRKYLVVGESE